MSNIDDIYKAKYLKYKSKYTQLKEQEAGGLFGTDVKDKDKYIMFFNYADAIKSSTDETKIPSGFLVPVKDFIRFTRNKNERGAFDDKKEQAPAPAPPDVNGIPAPVAPYDKPLFVDPYPKSAADKYELLEGRVLKIGKDATGVTYKSLKDHQYDIWVIKNDTDTLELISTTKKNKMTTKISLPFRMNIDAFTKDIVQQQNLYFLFIMNHISNINCFMSFITTNKGRDWFLPLDTNFGLTESFLGVLPIDLETCINKERAKMIRAINGEPVVQINA